MAAIFWPKNDQKCYPHLGFKPAPSREQKMSENQTKALPLSYRGIT